MKNLITVISCISITILVLLFRSEMYEIPAKQKEDWPKESVLQKQSAPVTVLYHDRRPYYVGVKGEVHGLVADPIGVALKLAGIDFAWVDTPAVRQLDIIRGNTSVTCAAGWFKTLDREIIGKYTLPVYQDKPFVGITRSDNDLLGEQETLARVLQENRLRLLLKSGYSYGTYLDENIDRYGPWIIVTTSDNSEMLEMLREHRADYCFMSEEEAYDLLLYSGVNKADYKIVTFKDIPQGSKRYLICSLMTPDVLMERINGAISHILPHMK